MLHTKFRGNPSVGSGVENFLKGFYHIWAWRPSWSCDPDAANKIFRSPYPRRLHIKLASISQAVSEKKMFEHCGRRRRRKTEGRRTPDHGYTISSPMSLPIRRAN